MRGAIFKLAAHRCALAKLSALVGVLIPLERSRLSTTALWTTTEAHEARAESGLLAAFAANRASLVSL